MYVCVCVCARVCVHECAFVCVRAHMQVHMLKIQLLFKPRKSNSAYLFIFKSGPSNQALTLWVTLSTSWYMKL